MILLVVLLAVAHLVVFVMSVEWKYDTYQCDGMSHTEWARFKIKCFFWEVFAPYFIVKWAIYVAQEVYDTVTAALQKNEETEDRDV